MREEYLEVKLPGGLEIRGTFDQVRDAAERLGFDLAKAGWYRSESRGLIPIATMTKEHTKNAMLVLLRKWSTDLSSLSDGQLINAIRNGCMDTTFIALLTHYIDLTRK